MLKTNTVLLLRKDDPRREIREVWIYTLISPCELWEAIRFLDDEHMSKRSKLALGKLRDMEARLAKYVAELQADGFVILERKPEPEEIDQ